MWRILTFRTGNVKPRRKHHSNRHRNHDKHHHHDNPHSHHQPTHPSSHRIITKYPAPNSLAQTASPNRRSRHAETNPQRAQRRPSWQTDTPNSNSPKSRQSYVSRARIPLQRTTWTRWRAHVLTDGLQASPTPKLAPVP